MHVMFRFTIFIYLINVFYLQKKYTKVEMNKTLKKFFRCFVFVGQIKPLQFLELAS